MTRLVRFILKHTDKACQLMLVLYVLYMINRHVKIAALLGAVTLIVQKTNPEAYKKFKEIVFGSKKKQKTC